MRSVWESANDNLALWREAAADTEELKLLQEEALGRACATEWQKSRTEAEKGGAPLAFPLPRTKDAPSPFARASIIEEQMAFLRGFLDVCPDFLQETRDPPPSPAPAAPRVVFLESFFGREALRRFEAVLPLPLPVTAPSFTAVCEELAGDRADFALLPLEDSKEGRFLHLYEEIDRFELHVTHTCEISYAEGGRTVTMALLSRRYLPPLQPEGERMLSCTLFGEDPHALTDLLIAAECAGLTLQRLDTLPGPYENGIFYHPVFRAPSEGAQALFQLYLAVCQPRGRLIGQYLHLKEE